MKSSHSIILICIGILLSCSDFKNPFENSSNSRMIVLEDKTSISLDKVDTTSIFTTETLTLAPAVIEQMDSFTVSVSGNRFRLDTTVTYPQSSSYRFLISFFDTGKQIIKVTTSKVNGETHLDFQKEIYVKNPLSQKDIPRTDFNKAVSLSTHPVGDQGINYNWQFGSTGEIVGTSSPKVTKIISNANTDEGLGFLWVSDTLGHTSPRVPFKFEFFDTTHPKIVCKNDNLDITSNEVSTSQTNFGFQVNVTDGVDLPVKTVLFNGEPYDSKDRNNYTKFFKVDSNNTKDNPLKVIVDAVDNIQFANHAAKTFFIVFNPEVKTETRFDLAFDDSGKIITTSLKNYTVRGSVWSSINRKILVSAELNGKSLEDTAFGDGFGKWLWKLQLSNDTNTFTVMAADTAGTEFDEDTLTIVYKENSIDSVGPTIKFIKINNRQIDLENPVVYSESDSVDLTIAASDNGSGVISFTVNNDLKAIEKSDYFEFNKLIKLVGSRDSTINIKVRDSVGNKTEHSLLILLNHPPYQTGTISIPYAVETGTLYTDTIHLKDIEDSRVIITIKQKPPQMQIDSLGAISWKPLEADTGKDSLVFYLYDGTSFSNTYVYHFAVIDPKLSKPVKFSEAQQFPGFVQAGDTLEAVLKLENGTGRAPFKFTANIMGQKDPLLDHCADSLFKWVPREVDTGMATIRAVVEDDLLRSDTLFRNILVVRRNSDPCSLSYQLPPGFKMTDDGSLDMRTAFSTARINIKIHDNDDPLTEQHVVSFTNCHMVSTSNTDSFFIEINPSTTKTTDTVAVVVSDKTGTTDSLVIPILYLIKSPLDISNLVSAFDETSVNYDIDNHNTVGTWVGGKGSSPITFQSYSSGIKYVENGVNGHGYLNFSGSSAYLSASDMNEFASSPYTIFIVARKDINSSDFMPLLSFSTTNNSNYYTSFGIFQDNKIGFVVNQNALEGKLGTDVSSWNICAFSSKGTIHLNGLVDGNINSNSTNENNVICIGSITDTENKLFSTLRGSIAEVLFFNRQLDDAEIAAVERFLANKYGLSVNMTR